MWAVNEGRLNQRSGTIPKCHCTDRYDMLAIPLWVTEMNHHRNGEKHVYPKFEHFHIWARHREDFIALVVGVESLVLLD